MKIYNGAPHIARTLRIMESEGRANVELNNGEVVVWTGMGALAMGRQLEASVKAGRIRTLLITLPDGDAEEVHVGPDVTIVHDGEFYGNERR